MSCGVSSSRSASHHHPSGVDRRASLDRGIGERADPDDEWASALREPQPSVSTPTFGRAARLGRAAQAASPLSVAEFAFRARGAVDEQPAVRAEVRLPALGPLVVRTALDTLEDDGCHLVVLGLRRQLELLDG